MKVLILNIFFLIAFLTTLGQDTPAYKNKSQKVDFTKYSLTERANFYPFNKTYKIVIVSFDKQVKYFDSSDWGSGKYEYQGHKEIKYGLPFLNDTICLSKLRQAKSLSTNLVDSLTDILYNTCYRWTNTEESKAMCYLPHNAILFFDKNDKVFDYIEICFDCHKFKYSNKKIEKFQQCDFTVFDLKIFFKQMGIDVTEKDFESKTSR